MKHCVLIFALTAAVLGTAACVNLNGSGNNPYKELKLSTKSAALARQGNTFAFEFIDRVNDATADDYIISPLSMQFLLGMILNGAQGATADEICKVLGYGSGEVADVNAYCLSMLQQLPDLDKKTKLSIANALFVNQKYSLLSNYKQTVGKFYEAEVASLDFTKNAATRKINDWCSDHTNGLIPKILDEVSPSMLAYLLNAIYFKSQWQDKFSKGNTSPETFTDESGVRKKIQMMKTEKHFTYQENDVFRAVRLPYGNGAFAMTVILPIDGKKLSDVTDYIDGENWEEFVRTMVRCEVDLWLPKFETKFHIKLNDILSAMGMPSSFDSSKADFKALSDQALCLSFVQQDAVIKVDEDGTEAAVVSHAGWAAAAINPGQHVVFHADRPFLYLITETSTGAVLFAGRYSGK